MSDTNHGLVLHEVAVNTYERIKGVLRDQDIGQAIQRRVGNTFNYNQYLADLGSGMLHLILDGKENETLKARLNLGRGDRLYSLTYSEIHGVS